MRRNRSGPVFSGPVFSGPVFSGTVFSGAALAGVLAGVLAVAGCAPAAAKISATSPAAARGQTHIMVYSINSDGPYLRAVVSGAVGDYGPAVSVYPDGTVDPAHDSDLEINLTRGSFRLSIAAIDKKLVRAASREPIYPRTCSDFMSVTAAAPIVAGSGTGSYRGISGSFTLTATVDEVTPKPCQSATAFLWQVITLAGPGTVSVG